MVTLKDNRKRSGLGRIEEGLEWVDLARSGDGEGGGGERGRGSWRAVWPERREREE